MPAFKCEQCGCCENTATSNYWTREEGGKKLCSLCDPEIGRWHGRFKRFKPEEEGLVEGPDGFLYSPGDRYLKELLERKNRSN